jgi:hypothetical protein
MTVRGDSQIVRELRQFDIGENAHAREGDCVSIRPNRAFASTSRAAGIVDKCDIIGLCQIDRRRRAAICSELQQGGGSVKGAQREQVDRAPAFGSQVSAALGVRRSGDDDSGRFTVVHLEAMVRK